MPRNDEERAHVGAWFLLKHVVGHVQGRWRRHLDPGIRRDAWKGKEDATLVSLYEQYGSQWSTIAKAIPGRTAQQCRARWGRCCISSKTISSRLSKALAGVGKRPMMLRFAGMLAGGSK